MPGILDSPEIAELVTLVEETARSTKEGVKHFVEPAAGAFAAFGLGPNALAGESCQSYRIFGV